MQSHPVTPSTLQLFSDRELQDHVRDGAECDVIEMQAKALAAQRWCEEYTNRDFLTTERVAYFDSFPKLFRLDRPPLQFVESVAYLDKSGDQQMVDPDLYRFTAGEPGRLFLRYGKCWPVALCEPDSIEVRFTAGWESAEDVPADIKQAVLFMFGHLWETREAVSDGSMSPVPLTVESYLSTWVAPRY